MDSHVATALSTFEVTKPLFLPNLATTTTKSEGNLFANRFSRRRRPRHRRRWSGRVRRFAVNKPFVGFMLCWFGPNFDSVESERISVLIFQMQTLFKDLSGDELQCYFRLTIWSHSRLWDHAQYFMCLVLWKCQVKWICKCRNWGWDTPTIHCQILNHTFTS